ncbi:myb family transcription factor PHL5-like [Durio zibethinus]|uniref:Myb family transcription factor PHL5-like n=1 Tax=Durio zibethinus TaxID=66656 RepID=A0A6P6APP3_DURZI|nr:myb family transcription factor PHL5-like [Durio zibethinus]
MDQASVSQQKQKRLISHSGTLSSSTPLEQLASAFSATDQRKISYFDFQAAESDSDESQAAGYQVSNHSSEHQAIPSSSINQAEDTLLSIVNPHLRRNNQFCHGFSEKSNAKCYWSQQGNLLSLDHNKLLAEATGNSKVSLCFQDEPEQQSSNFSRISGTCGGPVSSGARPSNIKTRLKWTADLHEKFVNCVNLLGGAEKATPRAILKLMKSNGLTLLHVKSHLQKYRYAKCITDSTQGKADQRVDGDEFPMLYLKSGLQGKEILQMQLELQRHLCQQLEIQQNLQQAIEEQGKQIQMMLEQVKKTNRAC